MCVVFGRQIVSATVEHRYRQVVEDIVHLAWSDLSNDDLTCVQWAYYYFSVQFRESLEIACRLFADDPLLSQLRREECDTANLSPYPGIAAPGERMNHDEFMRRILAVSDIDPVRRAELRQLGERYLHATRAQPDMDHALAISTYEDGGLEAVFRAILKAPDWDAPGLAAFRHFLVEHIRFDSDEDAGHGALSRHIVPDDRVLPLWTAFHDLFMAAAPSLRPSVALADAAE